MVSLVSFGSKSASPSADSKTNRAGAGSIFPTAGYSSFVVFFFNRNRPRFVMPPLDPSGCTENSSFARFGFPTFLPGFRRPPRISDPKYAQGRKHCSLDCISSFSPPRTGCRQGSDGPPMVLVHGFGGNADHWRKNIPNLAKTGPVYAIDLLGEEKNEKNSSDF